MPSASLFHSARRGRWGHICMCVWGKEKHFFYFIRCHFALPELWVVLRTGSGEEFGWDERPQVQSTAKKHMTPPKQEALWWVFQDGQKPASYTVINSLVMEKKTLLKPTIVNINKIFRAPLKKKKKIPCGENDFGWRHKQHIVQESKQESPRTSSNLWMFGRAAWRKRSRDRNRKGTCALKHEHGWTYPCQILKQWWCSAGRAQQWTTTTLNDQSNKRVKGNKWCFCSSTDDANISLVGILVHLI